MIFQMTGFATLDRVARPSLCCKIQDFPGIQLAVFFQPFVKCGAVNVQ